jgi:hypothetical protein
MPLLRNPYISDLKDCACAPDEVTVEATQQVHKCHIDFTATTVRVTRSRIVGMAGLGYPRYAGPRPTPQRGGRCVPPLGT